MGRRHRGLLSPAGYERLVKIFIELGEPRLYVEGFVDRLQEHAAPDPAHAHFGAGQVEIPSADARLDRVRA
jgi:hypothetical protein